MQIVEKRGGVRRIVAHIGSAHSDAELALLMQAARERLHAGQGNWTWAWNPDRESSGLGSWQPGARCCGRS